MRRCFIARTDRARRTLASHAPGYRDNARTLLASAALLAELATEDESYGNAIGLLAIHGTIGHADALAIAYGERKSVAGSHDQAVAILIAVLGDRFPPAERKRLVRVVSQKDSMAYQGRYVPLHDALELLKAADRFASWAERMFEQRP